jgi:hypothetical protein
MTVASVPSGTASQPSVQLAKTGEKSGARV